MQKTNFLERESNNITIATLYENYKLGKYKLDPPYQRNSVWSDEKKSFLIDSILKNFPIPPIFLSQHINDADGSTRYDVIDGKQRLLSIFSFIEGDLVASSESSEEPFGDDYAGKTFQELDTPELVDYKRRFWKYSIPIEYIDGNSQEIIESIFDRLNRNGEALTGQELRNATYHDSTLMQFINKFRQNPFWKERLKHVDLARMEDIEFLSELIFYQIEGKPFSASMKILDDYYAKYANSTEIDWNEIETNFYKLTNVLVECKIDFESHKVKGVSHLYAFWGLAYQCVKNEIPVRTVADKLKSFFIQLRQKSIENPDVIEYKISMSSRTKDISMRTRRVNAIYQYCVGH